MHNHLVIFVFLLILFFYYIFCRVTLDTLSVQATKVAWENKTEKAFWRGRDSRQERLDLVVMSRKEPELIDAALTHMFFFKKEPEKYGELVKSTPFFDFFNVSLFIHIFIFSRKSSQSVWKLPRALMI